MRIIDSNKDYYDFYQNIYRDSSLTFDRRDSYELSKIEFAGHFYEHNSKYYHSLDDKKRLLLLQIGYNYWLIELKMTQNGSFGKCLDYELSLLSHWKDYREKKLIELSHISVGFFEKTVEDRVAAISAHNYRVEYCFNSFRLYRDTKYEKKTIPILKNIGIASIIPPLDIYLSLEEYFSTEKSDKEVISSIDLTNDDKITNHGFDLKTSFRGAKRGKNV